MLYFLLIIAAGYSFAAQSVNVTSACTLGSNCPSVSLPNSGYFTTAGNGNQRWEFRITSSGGFTNGPLAYFGPFEFLIGSGQLQITNAINPPVTDTLTGASAVITMGSVTDVTVQLERNVSALTYSLQMCVTSTSVCQVQTFSISSLGTAVNWDVFQVSFASGIDVAWMRWFSTLAPVSNLILNVNTGDVLDWEFESTLADSVIGLTFSNPGVTYTATPTYAPTCRPLIQQTFAVGVAGTVTAANLCQPLDGGSTLTPLWTYLGMGADAVTQSLTFGTASALTTVISGYIKGSVNLNLQVTDGSAQSTNVQVHDGAVTVGSVDLVNTSSLPAAQRSILGPMLRWGSPHNRVPWFDDRNKMLEDLQGQAMAPTINTNGGGGAGAVVFALPNAALTGIGGIRILNGAALAGSYTSNFSPTINGTCAGASVTLTVSGGAITGFTSLVAGTGCTFNFPDYWDTAAAGTVNVSPTQTCGGSGAGFGLVGSGTGFNSGYSVGDYLVIWWNGGLNRTLNQVASVSSATCIVLLYGWQTGSTETGLTFSHATSAQIGNWGEGQASIPGNYYDNVKAHRSFYERSGIDTYWTYYTTLADEWWNFPPNDQGQSYVSGANSQYLFTSRNQSLEGMYLRANDPGMSSMDAGLILINELDIGRANFVISGGASISDTRETAYETEFPALYAQFGTNGIFQTTTKTFLSNIVGNYFAISVGPNGNVPTLELTLTDITNPVTVTHGSATLTCSGCAFTSGQWPGPGANNAALVTYTPFGTVPAGNSPFSSVYYPTFVSSTQLALDRVYSESSSVGTNTGWAYSPTTIGVPGWGAQPFMTGIEATALEVAKASIAISDPTNSAAANTVAQGDAVWLTTRGYADPAHGGVGGEYYFQDYLNCAFPVQTTTCTLGFDASQARADAGEVTRGLLNTYLIAPTTAKLTFLATLVDQMFCKPGFAGAGTTCNTDGFYISDLDNNQTFMSSLPASNKWLGFFFGWDGIINSIATLTQAGAVSTGGIFGTGTIFASGLIH